MTGATQISIRTFPLSGANVAFALKAQFRWVGYRENSTNHCGTTER